MGTAQIDEVARVYEEFEEQYWQLWREELRDHNDITASG